MRSLSFFFLFLLVSIGSPAGACFGPKLFLGTPAGEEGELLYHLVAIYIKEKTGVESVRLEMAPQQTAESLLQGEEVDLVFSPAASRSWPTILEVGTRLWLLNGPRPTDDLQFTTVPRALAKLGRLLNDDLLNQLRTQVAAGQLPAKVVRSYYMQQGWI